MIATIIKDAEREDATIKDAINNYKPKEQDYFKLRTLLSTWVELNIDCNAIDLYLNRAKSVGIDTTGLKDYLDEYEFIIK